MSLGTWPLLCRNVCEKGSKLFRTSRAAAGVAYFSSWMRFVRSRDQRQILSQRSRERRTTQRASHVPSGFPQASHSFCDGFVGLRRCVETVKSVMIAIIYFLEPNPNKGYAARHRQGQSGAKCLRQANNTLTWDESTTSEQISDTSSFRARLFRPYPKKTRIRPAMESRR